MPIPDLQQANQLGHTMPFKRLHVRQMPNGHAGIEVKSSLDAIDAKIATFTWPCKDSPLEAPEERYQY
jgi:hypothetical protein